MKMKLQGANLKPEIRGLDRQPGTSNYFIGRDPKQWRTNIPSYAKVKYEGVYPGIDLVYYGNNQQLEYDFVVAAGADPHAIALDMRGADKLQIDAHGDLLLTIGGGQLRQLKPSIYQETAGGRSAISGRYILTGKHQIGFEVGPYDHRKPLVIDPVLVYSTYLGGSGADEGAAIAADVEGNAYVVGTTDSLNFPTTTGAYQTTPSAGKDVFLTKLAPNGTSVIYSTYLGGSLDDYGYGVAVDSAGNAYLTGTTASPNFPTTRGTLQAVNAGRTDAFVAKVNSSGSALVYSTYLGGPGIEEGFGIAVNAAGNAYVTGVTASTNFSPTRGVMQDALSGPTDAFVTKLNPDGTAGIYSTYLGGSGADIGYAIALDAGGDNAYVGGLTDSTNFPTTAGGYRTSSAGNTDAFVVKLNSTGSAAGYATLLGGTGIDAAFGLTVNSAGAACVTGATDSTDFPTTIGALQATYAGGDSDAFVTELDPAGSALIYSTYLGGSGADVGSSVALDHSGNAYIAGTTWSANFPTTTDVTQPSLHGANDAFLARLKIDGTNLLYSTYLGGAQSEESFGLAVDQTRNAYITGVTTSEDFPITIGAYQVGASGTDAFITKVADVPTNAPPMASCKNITNPADNNCQANVTAQDINDGSSDPDGDPITLALNTTGPFGLGPHSVTLTVTDANGASSSCAATVSVVDKTPPSITPPPEVTAATGAGATLGGKVIADAVLGAADASDNCLGVTITRRGVPANNFFPVGTTTLTYTATDGAGNTSSASQRVRVFDDTPPVITGVTVDKPTLWPPNHRMVDVTVGYAATDNSGAVNARLSVASNEPANGSGEGNSAPDWDIVDAHHVRLRAERSGGSSGRIYTITITATDRFGNTSTQTVRVLVPHN